MARLRAHVRRLRSILPCSRHAAVLAPALAGAASLSGCATPDGHAGAQHAAGAAQAEATCQAPGVLRLQSVLYFGQARPGGEIGEAEWQAFLRDEVHARFPNGLTHWQATGEWRGASGVGVEERTQVVVLLTDDSEKTRTAIEELIERYKTLFEQEAVLWVTSSICAVT
jgi:hypothetical protein